jgi:hypothetical protein
MLVPHRSKRSTASVDQVVWLRHWGLGGVTHWTVGAPRLGTPAPETANPSARPRKRQHRPQLLAAARTRLARRRRETIRPRCLPGEQQLAPFTCGGRSDRRRCDHDHHVASPRGLISSILVPNAGLTPSTFERRRSSATPMLSMKTKKPMKPMLEIVEITDDAGLTSTGWF